MTISKEDDLTLAALLYVARCQAEGEVGQLADMGLSDEDIDAIRSLTLHPRTGT